VTEDRQPRKLPYAMTPGERTFTHRLAIAASVTLLLIVLAAMVLA
jgi:hypothetical protein